MHAAAAAAIARGATRWVRYTVQEKTEESYRQASRGRPGPETAYRRIEKKAFQVTCDVDVARVAYDAVSDGCWPLISNDKDMTGAQVLAAYRYQPNLERRHHLLKGIQDAAPIWIKTIPRIEAIFLCHFIALLDQRPDRAADPHGNAGRRDRQAGHLPRVSWLRRPHR